MGRAILDDLFSLDGRVALVTGASSGIGRELACGLAQAGARVALAGRSRERLEATRQTIADQGGEADVFPAELDDLDTIGPMLTTITERFGSVEVLINCAGINQREPITAVTPETFSRIMDINLRTPYFLSQAVYPGMVKQGGGKIVNIGSLTTSWGVGNLSVYGLSKSAIGQMTRVMAVEWAASNVQVNCICPGWIETELTQPLWADEHRRRWILEGVPAGRPGKPRDLVGMAIYLASPAADFTTGQTFYIDGGFTAGGQW
jgi:NAD(P)-dependent dehydrogenase (short-subunit alcohol dehydrogenase family)